MQTLTRVTDYLNKTYFVTLNFCVLKFHITLQICPKNKALEMNVEWDFGSSSRTIGADERRILAFLPLLRGKCIFIHRGNLQPCIYQGWGHTRQSESQHQIPQFRQRASLFLVLSAAWYVYCMTTSEGLQWLYRKCGALTEYSITINLIYRLHASKFTA